MIHLKKFTAKEDWTPIKLDVEVEMPDLLDLSWLEGKGLQPNEELLPEVTELEHPQPQYDPAIIDQLTEMGFPLEACKRAVFFTENGGFEEATNWLMTHIADDNFSEPFVPPGIMKKSWYFSFSHNFVFFSIYLKIILSILLRNFIYYFLMGYINLFLILKMKCFILFL